ncbi:hypothetical protein L7F22_047309 [Adiantum nelumboides]|nr:hypothetical protein [Adiantum nelumboides]
MGRGLRGVGVVVVVVVMVVMGSAEGRYSGDFEVTWGPDNVKTFNNDHALKIILDNVTASGFGSKKSYLFGSFQMNLKLVRGDSAGTVTAYYFASDGDYRDELDFEFLGNVSRQPYILQTNVFWNGTGGREQRNYLWFDPTAAYHNYSVIWNPQQIIMAVDGIPIRVVKNNEDIGIPYLRHQAMKIYASIWDGSIWATQGGAVKINWAKSPFVASFGKYSFDACKNGKASCTKKRWWNNPPYQTFGVDQQSQLAYANQYKVYDYCEDKGRYPDTPTECAHNNI